MILTEDQIREQVTALVEEFDELMAQIELRQKAYQQVPRMTARANWCQGAMTAYRTVIGEQEQEDDGE